MKLKVDLVLMGKIEIIRQVLKIRQYSDLIEKKLCVES